MSFKLVLTNRADIDQKTFFEDYGSTGVVCHTCHCKYGPMFRCNKCGNIICEACVKWSKADARVLNLNTNRKTKAKQRYVLETLKFNSYNCNRCKKVVGFRY